MNIEQTREDARQRHTQNLKECLLNVKASQDSDTAIHWANEAERLLELLVSVPRLDGSPTAIMKRIHEAARLTAVNQILGLVQNYPARRTDGQLQEVSQALDALVSTIKEEAVASERAVDIADESEFTYFAARLEELREALKLHNETVMGLSKLYAGIVRSRQKFSYIITRMVSHADHYKRLHQPAAKPKKAVPLDDDTED